MEGPTIAVPYFSCSENTFHYGQFEDREGFAPTDYPWHQEAGQWLPDALDERGFQLDAPERSIDPLERWQCDTVDLYNRVVYDPTSLHMSWQGAPFKHREPSPVETVFSSYSSPSSALNFNSESHGCETLPRCVASGAYSPLFAHQQYWKADQFGSVSDSPVANHGHCISPRALQACPDPEPRAIYPEEHDYLLEDMQPQQSNLFQLAPEYDEPMAPDAELAGFSDDYSDVRDDEAESYASDANDSEYTPSQTKSSKRGSSRRNGTNLHATTRARVTKRGSTSSANGTAKRVKTSISSPKSLPSSDSESKAVRPFTCPLTPYGCTRTFASKNEWKRHITSQHMCLGHWQCNLCPDRDTRPNIFNRKDLFVQHIKRMHPSAFGDGVSPTKSGKGNPKAAGNAKHQRRDSSATPHERLDDAARAAVDEICDECWCPSREPPSASTCAFCKREFEGAGSWEEWLEHTGRHLASLLKHRTLWADGQDDASDVDLDVDRWAEDSAFRAWLLEHGDIVPGHAKGTWMLAKRPA